MQLGDRRSHVPSDLLPEQLALLADLAAQISHPALRARVADVAWTYGERSRVDLLDVAIDAYRAVAPGLPDWKKAWTRALQLARRRGVKNEWAAAVSLLVPQLE